MATDNLMDSIEVLEPAGLAQRPEVGLLSDAPEESPGESAGPGDHLEGEYDQSSTTPLIAAADVAQSEQPRTDATANDFWDLESDSGSDYSEEDGAPLVRFNRDSTHTANQPAHESHTNDYFSFPTDEQGPVEKFPFGRPQWWFDYARAELEDRYGSSQAVLKHVYSVSSDDIEYHPRISKYKWTRGMHDTSRPKSLLNPATQRRKIDHHTRDSLSLTIPLRPSRPESGLFDDNDSGFPIADQISLSPIDLASLPESSSKRWADLDDEDEATDPSNWVTDLLADAKARFDIMDAFTNLPFDNDSEVWDQVPARKDVLRTNNEEQSNAGPDAVRTTLSPDLSGSAGVDQEHGVPVNSLASVPLTVEVRSDVSDSEGATQTQDIRTHEVQDTSAQAQSGQIESDCSPNDGQKSDHAELLWRKKLEKMKAQLEKEKHESDSVLIAHLNECKEENGWLVEQLSTANSEIATLRTQSTEPKIGITPTEVESMMQENERLKQENERLKQLLLTAQKACQHMDGLLEAKESKPQVDLPQPSSVAYAKPSAASPVPLSEMYKGWNFADPLRPDKPETEEEKQARWRARAAKWKAESPRYQAKLKREREETAEQREQRLREEKQARQARWDADPKHQAIRQRREEENAREQLEWEEEQERDREEEAKSKALWDSITRRMADLVALCEDMPPVPRNTSDAGE